MMIKFSISDIALMVIQTLYCDPPEKPSKTK